MKHHIGCNWVSIPNMSLRHGFWCDCGAIKSPVEAFNTIAVLQILCFLAGTPANDGKPLVTEETILDIPVIRVFEGPTIDLKERYHE